MNEKTSPPMTERTVLPIFTPDGDGAHELILHCPACGSDYTHQSVVTVNARPKEDGPGVAVMVDVSGLVTQGPLLPPGFVGRRQDLHIRFECEQCDGGFRLWIAQHKGRTFLSSTYARVDRGAAPFNEARGAVVDELTAESERLGLYDPKGSKP